MKLFYILIICLFFGIENSMSQRKEVSGVFFEEDYSSGLEKLKKRTQKRNLLFVYCYRENDLACSKMSNLILKMRQVGDFVNNNFISVQVDIEKKEYKDFVARYQLTSFPTFLILDKDENEIGRFCGKYEPEEFIKKLTYTMNPENSLHSKLLKYQKDKTTEHALECLEAYYQSGRISEMVDFLEKIYYIFWPEQRYSMEMWKYVKFALTNVNSPIFSIFIREKYLVNQYLGNYLVDRVMADALRQNALEYVSGKLKDAKSAVLLNQYLAVIDDNNLATHYIVVATELYAQRNFVEDAYESILRYVSAEKVCALELKDRIFVEKFLFSIQGMPKDLLEQYKKDRDAYFQKQLDR